MRRRSTTILYEIAKRAIDIAMDIAFTPIEVAADAIRCSVCVVRGHVPPPLGPHPHYADMCERCGGIIPKPYDFMHASGASQSGRDGNWKDEWNKYPPKDDDKEPHA